MASIPNLSTLLTGRRGSQRRGGGKALPEDDGFGEENTEDARDKIVQETDHDAGSSRMSAISLGYLEDAYAQTLFPPGQAVPKRYPIINRGTYVRTKAIDHLLICFLNEDTEKKKQIVSLGAGSDTRFFRFWDESRFGNSRVEYHELDFETNINRKRSAIRGSTQLAELV